MYKMLVTLNLKPGMLDATLAAGVPFVEATRKEPGCISFDAYRATDGRDCYVAVECFRDKEAYAAHRNTPHTLEFLPLLGANLISASVEMLSPPD